MEWSSEDATIATVDNGVVTAKKIGTTNIVVKSKANASVSATCKVTVKDNVILSNVSAKHEFVLFEQNRAKDEKNDDREAVIDHGDPDVSQRLVWLR